MLAGSLFGTFGVSLLVSLLLLATSHRHAQWSADSADGVQRSHSASTPRIGGIAVLAGVLAGWAWAPTEANQTLLGGLILAGMPAFAFGLAEDLTKRISVRVRLLAALSCGVLGYLFTGLSITDVQVPGMDWLLSFTLLSVAFTAFALAGVANAINIIDGMNGLAGGTVLLILCSFVLLSQTLGDAALLQTCLVLGAATFGFMLINWPIGKLFLGDGGAYFLGFSVAWVAVLLLWRHPQVSAWAPLLICSFPVLEVLFSMRRRWRRDRSIDAPDRLHLHSLVKRRLVRRMLPNSSQLVRNSVTGALMWGASLVPAWIALNAYTNTPTLVLGLALSALLYAAAYARLTQFRWCFWSLLEQSFAKNFG
jgi:UDP-N-acetylmuramyl pentapeptide phosphotransferase/UDP-N-acetylglucosamine-1-phosphate transferase